MYVNNHLYDRLRVCAVGRTWPEEFYNWVPDVQIREIMQTVSRETEEDYQALIKLLQQLGVEVLRPTVNGDSNNNIKEQILKSGVVPPPPMFPGDCMAMIDNVFYTTPDINTTSYASAYEPLFELLVQTNSVQLAPDSAICAAMSYQFRDRVCYSINQNQTHAAVSAAWKSVTDKNLIGFHQHGHIDGCFCPVTPGLIVSMEDLPRPHLMSLFYRTHFKDWKIIIRGPSLEHNSSFKKWQKSHSGLWWVPGQEKNQKFIDFVNQYFNNWIGDVSETIFEVNIIVIDDKNIIVRQTNNDQLIREIESMGVNVYQSPFRHSAFWDGGLNCVTLPLHRQS